MVLFCPWEVLFIFVLWLIALEQHLSAVSSTLEMLMHINTALRKRENSSYANVSLQIDG